MDNQDVIDALDCFDPDDLPEPRDILTGECITLPNKNTAVCYEVMNQVLDAIEQRGKDLNVPRTSDECNQIWVAEIEMFVMFMQENFPLEVMVLAITTIHRRFVMPDEKIAPANHLDKVYGDTLELFF